MLKVTEEVAPRDLKIVKMLADGKSVPDIAKKLEINARTLERNISELKSLYNCNTLPQLVAFFFRHQFIK
jgi:DNA-binding NarL/FixJ family response regulator